MTVDLVQEPTPSLPESPAPRTVPAGRRRSTPRAHVVAVVVARDGAARLPRVLTALASATRAPDALVGVDLGSADASADLLAAAMPVLALPRSATVHDAVEAALALRAAGRLGHADAKSVQVPDADSTAPGVVEWVWLLPHDAAPAPDVLEQLLLAVETAPSVGVAGCKQVSWNDDQRLLDVGFTASSLGLRVTGVDRGEVDQGQHDDRRDVLAVSGAGMLVRRDVWEALGGLDPALDPAVAGDLDLCRRAHLAGWRVLVVPTAVVARAPTRPHRQPARHAVLHLRLAAVPAPLLPLAAVAVVALAPLRALLLLAAGRRSAAVAELAATAGVLAHPLALLRTRRRVVRARQVPPSVLRTLRPPVDLLLRQRYDTVHSWVTPPLPDAPPPPPAPRPLGALALLVLATVAAGGVLGRHLLPGFLAGTAPASGSGPRLPPTPLDAATLWAAATGTWRHVGLGARAVADPWPGLLALLAAPVGGDPALAQRLLLVVAVPLAALVAWCAAAAVTGSRRVRWWAALAWAAAPPLLAAVSGGRPAAVVAHVLLPLAVLAAVRCRAPGTRAWGGVARLGLVLTALLAAAPALTAPVLLVLAGAAVLPVAADARRRWLPLLAAAVPAVLLLPWWWAVVRAPRLLLAVADGTQAGLPAAAPDARGFAWWHLLALPAAPGSDAPAARLAALAHATGHGWPAPAALTAVVVVLAALVVVPAAAAAAAGAARRRAGGAAALGWAAAGLGLLLAALVRAGGAPSAVGPALSLALAGLGLAALLGAQVLPAVTRRTLPPRPARAVLAGAVALAVAGPAVALAVAAAAGTGPARAGAGLPALAVAEARGPNATRTLVLQVDRSPSRLRWALVRGGGLVVGDTSAALAALRAGQDGATTDRDAAVVLPVLATMLSAAGGDARPALAELAVGSVALLPPTHPGTVLALDAAPGFTRVAGSNGSLLWRVDPPAGSALSRPARARVVDAASGRALLALPSGGPSGDRVVADLDPGPAGRLVVLAERHDAGWRATLDGVPLAPARQGWAQAFVLPGRGGHLEVMHDSGVLALADPARIGLLGVALLLALPLPRLRGRAGPPRPPRPSRPLPRPATAPDDLQPAALPQVYDDDHHPEDGARPLYIGPPPRGLRRRSRLRRRPPPGGRRTPPPGGQP